MTGGSKHFPRRPHVGQPWLTACYRFTKIVCRDWHYTLHRERTEQDGEEKYRAKKKSVKSWSMDWRLLSVKTFSQSLRRWWGGGSILFHGVPTRKIKKEGEFVMSGWKPGDGNPFLLDFLWHCLALRLTGLKSVWMMLVMKLHDNYVYSAINRICCITGHPIIDID